jgi:IS5 family transposase
LRHLFKQQLSLTSISIDELIGRHHTRDDIDKLVMGYNVILNKPSLRDAIINILSSNLNLSIDKGREGMDYWTMFVFGTARVSLNIDYDRLQNLVNNHASLRKVVGLNDFDGHQQYGLTTLKDNIGLISEDILTQINTLIVKEGQAFVHPYSDSSILNCRADSYVAMTDVHFPTDISLLFDAVRKVIELVSQLCKSNNIEGSRQHKHNSKKLKKLMHKARKSKKRQEAETKSAHQEYIDCAIEQLGKAQEQLDLLQSRGITFIQQDEINQYQEYANTFIDQIERRVLKGETIPHKEKIFSIFEPHTEWVSKGKTGVPVEFGVKLAVVQDQYQFILQHHIMQNQQDVHIAQDLVLAVQEKYGKIDSISLDRGFWSPENEEAIGNHVRKVVMPKKGYKSQERATIESDKEFTKLRYKHSAVESGINSLQEHGLKKVPDKGIESYKRYIAFGIVGYNTHLLGAIALARHYQNLSKQVA